MRFPLLLVFVIAAIAAGPVTRPATKPTSRPAKKLYTLMHGGVRFLVLADWTETMRSDNDAKAQYQSPDQKTNVIVAVAQQDYAFPTHNDALIEKMKATIINGMRAKYKENGYEILYGPRSETDDRFLLRIHVRYKHGDDVMDEMHTYSTAGIDMFTVMTQVKTDQPAEAKLGQEKGGDICLSIILGKTDRKRPSNQGSTKPS
jgi:hypothetical protein